MNRQGLLLGFYATGAQVLLLRELQASLNGSELFIGVALFGWLVAVAAGSHWGGRADSPGKVPMLLCCGAMLLPPLLVATRLSTLLAVGVVGEVVPFSTAFTISICVTLPIGFLAGWLFAAILTTHRSNGDSIVRLYFLEGIGAGIAGIIVTLLAGSLISTLTATSVILAIVLAGLVIRSRPWFRPRNLLVTLAATAAIASAVALVPSLDRSLDGAKYPGFQIARSFDTPYSHQAILTRNSTQVMLTDNNVEGVWPDLATAENLLLPPLAYLPEARSILIFGRAEFGAGQLVQDLSGVKVTAVDPRSSLNFIIDGSAPDSLVRRINDDPLAFAQRLHPDQRFDIIILNPGDFGTYRNSRLLSERFLRAAKKLLSQDGILFVPTNYDSDRYITADEKEILATIGQSLHESFREVEGWPGTMTLFFASDEVNLDLTYDSLISNLSKMSYVPFYISDYYLRDRLNSLKYERLQSAMSGQAEVNSLNRPVMSRCQTLYRSKLGGTDRELTLLLLNRPWWSLAVPLLILLLFAFTVGANQRRQSYGLFLYFTAGGVSLTLEMISFYVFQSSAGSLYSEMAALIGVFMFGLSAGTYVTAKLRTGHADVVALIMLLAASVTYAATYQTIPTSMLLAYHLLFLLTVAVGTGSLFAAATRRYYRSESQRNCGAGYAMELAGSAIGAILPTTILLPVIGLPSLLLVTQSLLVVALIGCVLTWRQR